MDLSDCLRHCNGQWTALASWSESEFWRTRWPRSHTNQQCGNSSWLLKEVLGGWPDLLCYMALKKAFIVNLGSEMIREWVSTRRPSPFSCNCVAFPETSLPVSCLRARWMQSQAFSWALINISKQSWVNIRYLQSCSHAREDTSAPVRLTSNRSGSSRCFNIVANSTRCNKTYKKHNYSWKIKQIELHKRDGKCERLQTWTIWKHTTYALIFFSCCYQDTCMTDLTGSPFFCCCYAWQTGCSTRIQTHVKWIKKKTQKVTLFT